MTAGARGSTGSETRRVPEPLRVLLAGVVDYAGLFPPAALDMNAAVANFAEYVRSDDAWMLGRFVVPVGRLDELAAAYSADKSRNGGYGAPWRISALATADHAEDLERIAAFNAENPSLQVDSVELKAATADEISRVSGNARPAIELYVEIPAAEDPAPLVRAIAASGARAKIRTGGITRDGFPTSSQVVRFISSCVAAGVPFKATAGLHHPLCGNYPLSYAADAERGTMFGFLNVLLTAAFVRNDLAASDAVALLELRDATELRVEPGAIEWRGHRLSVHELSQVRERVAVSFGSCSFREPLDDLHILGLL